MELAAIESRLAEIHRGRKWILVTQVAVGAADMVATLTEWGAAGLLVVAGVEGVGNLPDVPVFYTRTSGPTMMAGLRAFEVSITDPSADLMAAIEEFDPDHEALILTRPLEMLVLRRIDSTGFVHAGFANYWDPPNTLRQEMRSAARSVGEHLIERVGYRGPYGIDGVLTSDGFRPTELNPRLTAGHILPAYAAGLVAEALATAELAGDLELDAEWLEETLLTAGDNQRDGRALMSLSDPLPDRKVDIAFINGKAKVVDEEHRHGSMGTGTSPQGGIVLVGFHPQRTPLGPSLAPLAVAALDLARTLWDLPIPPMEPAPDLSAPAALTES